MNILFVIYHPSELSNWIVKLKPYLCNANVSVIHIGKLHGINVKSVDNIDLYDVSDSNYKQTYNLVNEINPTVTILMSFRSLWELTMQRICIFQNRKFVYLEHGLFSQDTLRFRTNKLKNELYVTFKRQFKYLRSHLACIIHSKDLITEINVFYNVYLKGRFEKSPFDHYFLFSDRSFEKYSKLFNLKIANNTTLVGYPIFNDDQQKRLSVDSLQENGEVIYVHQPLIADGISPISFEEEKDWLVSIQNKLSNRYAEFSILLHPRADLELYKRRFQNTGIRIVKSPNNYLLFAKCSLIIGHYSTALLYGLYFEKPTIVLDYPGIANDDIFRECFNYFDSIDDLEIANVKVKTGVKEYMTGDNNTFEHIAKTLLLYSEQYDNKTS